MPTADREHLDYQRRYYARPERVHSRMAPVSSRYVLRHLERLLERLAVPPPARLLELGAGMGRFTLPLAERGYRVTAVDLTPELLAALREEEGRRASAGRSARIETVCCDAAEVGRHAPGPYDAAVGFFFLHHLGSVAELARGVAAALVPGARVAFCEPNAWNPSFYAQVLLTPGMTWRGDGGIARMRPGVLRPAFEDAGFVDVAIERYGLFPPALGNRPAFARLEERVERARFLEPILAFQIVSGTYRGPDPGRSRPAERLGWTCSRCGAPLEARGDDGRECPGCGWRLARRDGVWWAAAELRPPGFRPERRDHLEALERDHFWFPPRRRLLARLLDRRVGRPPGAWAVDLGCGTGGFLPTLRRRFAGVAAVDAYGESLAAAGGVAPDAVRVQADVSKVPLAAGQFALAAALDVLEHVEPGPFLAEAARLVEPGGWLLLTVPALPALWCELDEAAGHRRRYTLRGLAQELSDAGWEVVHWTHYQALLLPLVWLARRGPWSRARRLERRPPGLVGRALGAVNELEVRALGGLRLPWGSSLVVLARKGAP